jgi:hypothetical protein
MCNHGSAAGWDSHHSAKFEYTFSEFIVNNGSRLNTCSICTGIAIAADMLGNQEQCFEISTFSRGMRECEVRKVFCPEPRRSVDMVGNFFTVENAGVEDGGGGDIGKAFW